VRAAAFTAAFAVAASVGAQAVAGPPYVTDDPEPTETGHWENYHFVMGAGHEEEAGLDLNDGGAKDLQLTAIVPIETEDDWRHSGLGEIELAAKYRFLHQDKDGWTPDVAIFPNVTLPTGPYATGHATVFLPVWAQKDFDKWSVFGGGGYVINPGAGQKNYWLSGLAVTHEISDTLTIGPEVYVRTANEDGARILTGVNLGVVYKVSKHWSLLAAGGPQFEGHERLGMGYISLKLDY
jgi:hypothetical protein